MSPRRPRPGRPGRTAAARTEHASAARTARLLAAALGGSGVLHLVAPATYDAVVPRSMPGPARFWTVSSGVAEIVVAAALASRPTRRVGGALAAALFVAVFPANVSMATRSLHSARASRVRRVVTLVRLPLQVPLVTRALLVRRAG